MAAQAMGGSYQAGGLRSSSFDMDHHLPTYDPQSEVAKKEANRAKVAENLVHLIPFVLLLCTLILWFFSHPTAEISMVTKENTVVGKMKKTAVGGNHNKWNGSTMTIGMDQDLDSVDGNRNKGKKSKIKNKGSRN
ncbi:hypothetical protein Cni_G01494 [Canna indica]|uniref:Transmembrane protein n=1 Tax=Canna indica TaxID=4628 RepID=A0AAQ3JN96_9LILI|nr:hypothetical protein Cni_G01494 [Canna indica]